jgi:hypothetical protein
VQEGSENGEAEEEVGGEPNGDDEESILGD